MIAAAAIPVVLLGLINASYAALVVSTPRELIQCKPAVFDISGSDATGSYIGYVVEASDPCGDALFDFDAVTGDKLEWVVNLPVDTVIMVGLENSDEVEGWSGALVVKAGDSTDCLPSASSSSSADFSVNTANVNTPENAAESTPQEGSATNRIIFSGALLAVMGAISVTMV